MPGSKADLIWQIRAQQDLLKKDLAGVKSTMKRSQTNMNKVSKQISTTLRSAFGIFLVGSVFRNIGRTIGNFEKQIDKVAAVSGASEKEIKKLRTEAVELGRASKFTAIEIGKLQEELARKGFSASQISESSDAIRKLATVADSELAPAAASLAGTLKGFNLEATESERVANIMAESFSKSSLDLEKFTVATANSGAIANALGVSLERNTARLGTLVDANIDASKAGTDLRKIYVELNKEGISYDDALDKVGSSSDKVATATELVGIRAAAALVILSEQRDTVESLTSALGDNNKELGNMVSIMEDNLITDIDKLKSAWEALVLSMEDGEGPLANAARSLIQISTGLLNSLSLAATNGSKFVFGTNLAEEIKKASEAEKDFKSVVKEVERIIFGVTFDNVSVDTLSYSDAVKTLDSRLSSFSSHKFFGQIKEQIDSYKRSLKDANNEQIKFQAEQKKMQASAFTASSASLSGVSTGVDQASIESFGLAPTEQLEDYFFEVSEVMRSGWASIIEVNREGMNSVKGLSVDLNQIAQEMVVGLANAIGSGQGIRGVFAVLGEVLGSGMQQIGGLMVAYGLGIASLKKSLETLNPALAIGAGVALIAAGAAIRGAAGGLGGQIGGGSRGSSEGGSGGFQNNFSQQSIQLNGAFKIEGSDLVYVLNQEAGINNRNRSNG